MKRLLAFLLLFSAFGLAQGVRIGDGTPVSSTLNLAGVGNILTPSSTASISICSYPANAVPCTNKATTYTTNSLLIACSTSVQITLPGASTCVANADAQGEWGAWVAAGDYDYTITVGSHSYGPFTVSAAAASPSSVPFAVSAGKDAVGDLGFINPVTQCLLPTNGTSDSLALMRACRALYPGRHFVFPKQRAYNDLACDYTFSGSILTAADTNISNEWYDGGGTGGQAENVPSQVKFCFPSGVTAFEVASGNGSAQISNLHLVGGDCWDPATAATYVLPQGWGSGTNTADGIRPHSRMKLTNVWVQCFGRHGINIDTDGYAGNLNNFKVDTVRSTQNRGMGVYIRGVDSNAGRYLGIDSFDNQLDGINDSGFLSNYHEGHHTDANGVDGTANGSTINITNSVVLKNYATMTAATHGLAVGDYVSITNTVNGFVNGKFVVVDVPDANTFVVYTPTKGSASTVEVAQAFKRTGAAAWKITLTGCSITTGGSTLTCPDNFPDVTGYPITVIGAGAAGANLTAFTNIRTTSCNITSYQVVSNVLTVNCSNSFVVGWKLRLFSISTLTDANAYVTVATASGTQFTATVSSPDITLTSVTAKAWAPIITLASSTGVAVSAGATLTGTGTAVLMIRSLAYRSASCAVPGQWNNIYSEGGQNASSFCFPQLILSGDHGAGIDFANFGGVAPAWIRPDALGLHITAPINTFDTGNRDTGLTLAFQPGNGTANQSTLFRFYSYNTSTNVFDEKFRLSHTLDFFSVDYQPLVKSFISLQPTNSVANYWCESTGASCTERFGSDTANATIEGRSANVVKWGIDTTGLGTFNGGIKAGASGSTVADSRELVQNAHSCGTTTTCANTANGSNRIIFGTVALSSGTPSTATVASITAFTSTSSYVCVLTNTTNAANNLLKVVNTSTSSFTITGPNTVTDVIAYQCIGN